MKHDAPIREERPRRGRRRATIALAAGLAFVLALLLAAVPAGAARAPSHLVILAGAPFGDDGTGGVVGFVGSPNRRCLSGRQIEVSLTNAAGEVFLDVARSGANGGWYARGPADLLEDVTGVTATLAKRKIGKGPRALRCGGSKVVLD